MNPHVIVVHECVLARSADVIVKVNTPPPNYFAPLRLWLSAYGHWRQRSALAKFYPYLRQFYCVI